MSVLCSTWLAIQYTVMTWSTSNPSPNTTAPGSSADHGVSGARGRCQLTKSHAPTGMAMNSNVAISPARNDTVRSFPTRAEIASAAVTMSTSAPAALAVCGALPASVCHTSAWTMRSTFSSARVARNSANAATKNDTMRCPVERSPMPANAFAARPPIPASRAR